MTRREAEFPSPLRRAPSHTATHVGHAYAAQLTLAEVWMSRYVRRFRHPAVWAAGAGATGSVITRADPRHQVRRNAAALTLAWP